MCVFGSFHNVWSMWGPAKHYNSGLLVFRLNAIVDFFKSLLTKAAERFFIFFANYQLLRGDHGFARHFLDLQNLDIVSPVERKPAPVEVGSLSQNLQGLLGGSPHLLSKLVTPVWNHLGHLEGKQPQLGDFLTMITNHLLNGMILQVGCPPWTVTPLFPPGWPWPKKTKAHHVSITANRLGDQ